MKEYIPKTKDDLKAISILMQGTFEDVVMDIPVLLEYLQDLHWDVASGIGHYLAPHVNAIKVDLLGVLLSNDNQWKYGIIAGLIALAPVRLDEEIVSALRRIKDYPTEGEVDEELDLVAAEVLNRDASK
jgi:hypothetical protein